MDEKFIAWLSDLSKKDIPLAGEKAANLGEIYNSKFPVPQAFIITTKAFSYFLKETKLTQKIKDIMHKTNTNDIKDIQDKSEEIKQLISSTNFPAKLEEEILEAYDNFNVNLGEIQNAPGALAILKSAREPVFVSVRGSKTTTSKNNSQLIKNQSSHINIKGNPELLQKIKDCFASILISESICNQKKDFEEITKIAIIVQKMINSNKSGIIFSKNPIKNNDEILIEAIFGQGLTSGTIKPDQYILTKDFEILKENISDKKLAITRNASGQTKTITLTPEKSNERTLKTHELKQLAEYALKLEEHYNAPQDIEFSIEDGKIYILQTKPITIIKENIKQETAEELDEQIITKGMPASPGVASGTAKIVKNTEELKNIKEGDILVTTITNPDMISTMKKVSGILTSQGGVTSHAAIISREMGIPSIVGAQECLSIIKDGDKITINGHTGKVFKGLAENKTIEILPIVQTRTKVKVSIDLPEFAKRAEKTKAHGVGLVRLEALIATSNKHPLLYEEEGKLEDYKNMIKEGLKEIADTFKEKSIWIRSPDIRSDEYSNLQGSPEKTEKNPMLGNHGIRFSLKHQNIFKAELSAIKELADKNYNLGLILPQITSIEEIKKAKEIIKEIELNNIQLGVMIETPAAAILIKDICEQGIDFISLGTNDLTQYTLAADRGNEEIQDTYNEMSWAVLKQISRVIRECKKQGIETSICGEAASNPEMVKFLIKQGINGISVNAGNAHKISKLIQKLEINSQVEPIDNKEEIKKEILELKKLKKENLNPEPIEIIEDIKESKKEDIFK